MNMLYFSDRLVLQNLRLVLIRTSEAESPVPPAVCKHTHFISADDIPNYVAGSEAGRPAELGHVTTRRAPSITASCRTPLVWVSLTPLGGADLTRTHQSVEQETSGWFWSEKVSVAAGGKQTWLLLICSFWFYKLTRNPTLQQLMTRNQFKQQIINQRFTVLTHWDPLVAKLRLREITFHKRPMKEHRSVFWDKWLKSDHFFTKIEEWLQAAGCIYPGKKLVFKFWSLLLILVVNKLISSPFKRRSYMILHTMISCSRDLDFSILTFPPHAVLA